MRGTLSTYYVADYSGGIIPAYAGNTSMACHRSPRARDHPRVCGEHIYGVSPFTPCAGSSPRMRGTPADRMSAQHVKRIIPAYAGNTTSGRWSHGHTRDHPRVCGEHIMPIWMVALSPGSSPRMRGTPVTDYRGATYHGIIPAYAGNTKSTSGRVKSRQGSSPRMRGTLNHSVE